MVTVHFAWIAYVVLGQLLILIGIACKWGWIRNFWFRFTHLSMMLLVAVEALVGIYCPLTVWEQSLRNVTSIRYTEDDSLLARTLGGIIFYDQLESGAWQLVVSYLAFAVLVVASFVIAPPRLPVTRFTFVALVNAFIGAVLLATAWDQNWGVGVCFLIQAALWYGLQERTPASFS